MNEVLLWTNGYPVPGSCKEVFFELLSQIDVQYSPIEVVKENMYKIIDIMKEYCRLKREELEHMKNTKERTRLKTRYTRFLGYLDKIKEIFEERMVSIASIQKWYYDCLMSLKGMEPLRGFSTGTRFGDDLHIDPERESIFTRPRGRI